MSIKDFRVVEALGKGSFATVYKVMRKSDGKTYALKRVKIGKMGKKEVADALNEIRFLASIRHKNVVGFLEAFLENNESELCIVMEYCGCGDLSAKVERYKKRRQLIEETVIWRYLIQSLKALEYLHAKGICHRDLKAANSFIADDGSIKIGDMNVSKKFGKSQANLKTQIGTPYYMSPEIWQNKVYDKSCDIWSLGCMIYELCALRPPFLGNDLPGLKRSVLSGRFPSISSKYSSGLQRIIELMLSVNPRQRPSASDLLKHKEILTHLHLDEDGNAAPPSQRENQGLLKTINVPRNMRQLTDALPKPCYPDTRPHSPKSWLVSEQSNAKKAEKEMKSPDPAVEEPVPKSDNGNRERVVRFDTKQNQENRSPILQPAVPTQIHAVKHVPRVSNDHQNEAFVDAQRARRKAIAEDYLRRREEAARYKNRGQSQADRFHRGGNMYPGIGAQNQNVQNYHNQRPRQPRGFLPKI